MLTALLALIAAIPGIGSIVTGITGAFFNAKVQMTVAKLGVDRDVAVAMIQSEAQVTEGRAKMWGVIGASKLLTLLVFVFAVPVAWYEAKVVVYDTILGLGSTNPIHGDVEAWMNSVVYSLFGSATALAAVQHWWSTKP
jgi:hypothetical protein